MSFGKLPTPPDARLQQQPTQQQQASEQSLGSSTAAQVFAELSSPMSDTEPDSWPSSIDQLWRCQPDDNTTSQRSLGETLARSPESPPTKTTARHSQQQQQQHQQTCHDNGEQLLLMDEAGSKDELLRLRRLLASKDKELRMLRNELERYKLALSQLQLSCAASTATQAVASATSELSDSPPVANNHPAESMCSQVIPESSRHQHQSDQLNSSLSIANVVAAAAAVAVAAAANDQHHQQHHHHQHEHHLSQLNSHVRLISSAITSPDFEPPTSLHQQHHHSINAHHHHHQQPHSSISSLHYSTGSPSSSCITPSPTPLSMASHHQHHQSTTRPTTATGTSSTSGVASASSASLMSPLSPNFLRRQFMTDRVSSLLSSPPSSGLTGPNCSSSATSLAHMLQQHRSSSALSGVPSTSSTPMSSAGCGAGGGQVGSTAVSPLLSNKSSQARLNNMQIRHKFGYLGSGRAQFNSPHGFCLGLNQEIVVADTNNHRICIFDKSGTYITQFGSSGKEEGQLWNPRKVAILHRPAHTGSSHTTNLPTSGNQKNLLNTLSSASTSPTSSSHHLQHFHHNQNPSSYSINNNNNTSNLLSGMPNEPLYVVCDRGAERSRMQLFTKDGAFIKKIGIHYIDIVAGLAITQNGLIIVVDSVSPTVYIIDGETGILNGWFDCSSHMKEPSDIAVKSDSPRNEYFICDFKGHCVVVFSEQGEYLRKIGQDGLTSYPNGIDISDDGDILVGDSHGNRFHVVVFDRNGNFVSQFECPHVKVSRCCGLKITREGYIVTLAKNNHHVLVLDTIHI